jgi:hypothetical protein
VALTRLKKTVFVLAAILFGLPFLAYLGLRLGLATPFLNFALKKELGGLFNGELRFGSFRTDLFSFAEIRDLIVLARTGQGKLPVLTANSVRLNYEAWEVLRGRRSLEEAVELGQVSGLKLFLLRDQAGRWNIRDILKIRSKGRAKTNSDGETPLIFATRLVLDDGTVVFNDEHRQFQSTVGNLEGTLDARAFPLVVFSLSGRTEEQKRDNLSLAGEWNAETEKLYVRADMSEVPLKTYLNYSLPEGKLQFLDGGASLSVRVRQEGPGADLDFAGSADVKDGSLSIPGISQPLSRFQGSLRFGQDKLIMDGVRADFLGSTWQASGELSQLKAPLLSLSLSNTAVPLEELSSQIKGLQHLSLSGTASLALGMSGSVLKPVAQGHLSAPQLRIAGIDVEEANADLELRSSGLKVRSLSGRLWSGPVSATAEIAFPSAKAGLPSGTIDVHAEAQKVDLSQVRYQSQTYVPLSGIARVSATVSGALLRPDVKADLESSRAFFGSQALGSLSLGCMVEGKRLGLSLKTWNKKLDAKVSFDFQNKAEFKDSKVRLTAFPVSELIQAVAKSPNTVLITPALKTRMNFALSRYSGDGDVELGLRGPVVSPELSLRILRHEGRLIMPEGFFHAADKKGLLFRAKGLLVLGPGGLGFGDPSEPFRVSFVGGGREIASEIKGLLPLNAAQSHRKNGGLNVSLKADMEALTALELFSKAKGEATADLKISGSSAAPEFLGSMQIKDFGASMTRFFDEIKDGQAQLAIGGQNLVLRNLSFKAGGALKASGNLDFSAGWKPNGLLQASTDEDGLKLKNTGIGDLTVSLDSLQMAFRGEEGLKISGKAAFYDSVIEIANPKPKDNNNEGTEGEPLPQPILEDSAAPPQARYPVTYDLRAEIDDNVWLKKIHEGIHSLDPMAWLQEALNSARETFLSPAFEFLLKPTENDIAIQSGPEGLQLKGEVGIDRGSLVFMEQEFKIEQEQKVSRVRFLGGLSGKRGDVEAEAGAQVRWVTTGSSGLPEPHTAHILADVHPLNADELEQAGLQDSLLNYTLDFKSDPPLASTREQERQAILSLLVVGDPLTGVQTAGYLNPSQNLQNSGVSIDQILTIQAGRLVSGEIRKAINRFAKSLGGNIVDYVRVAPRLRYAGSGSTQASSQAGAQGQSQGISNQIQQEGLHLSWLFEAGRSLGKNLYSSGQFFLFGQDDVDSAKTQSAGPTLMEVRPYGAKAGLEWRLGGTRTIEASYSYSVDENLQPVAFDPDHLDRAHMYFLGIRNTIPTDNYSPRTARQRREAIAAGQEAPQ